MATIEKKVVFIVLTAAELTQIIVMQKGRRILSGMGNFELFFSHEHQGHWIFCKEWAQGVQWEQGVKAQGVNARSERKEWAQGVVTRSGRKEWVQGVGARSGRKE